MTPIHKYIGEVKPKTHKIFVSDKEEVIQNWYYIGTVCMTFIVLMWLIMCYINYYYNIEWYYVPSSSLITTTSSYSSLLSQLAYSSSSFIAGNFIIITICITSAVTWYHSLSVKSAYIIVISSLLFDIVGIFWYCKAFSNNSWVR